MKITKTFLIILFFLLPLLHGKFFPTIWIDFFVQISGNFEFTKSIVFNILCSFIFLSFLWENIIYKKHSSSSLLTTKEKQVLFCFIVILFISTLFSLSTFNSLIWDDNKWHTALLFFNLMWLYLIVRSLDITFIKKLIFTSIISAIIASLIAIKELFFGSYNYWALSSRALWTFGHPNYLAWFLLVLLPLTDYIKRRYIYALAYFIFFITLIFAQSIVAFVLLWIYTIYLVYRYILKSYPKLSTKIRSKNIKIILTSFWIFFSWFSIFILTLYFPEKLHSFLSRFYLWETTLKIIFSDIKIFIFWAGSETLSYIFNSLKSPELYIFENYWYSADRPHNFLLNIFYHFWFLGLLLFFYIVYLFYNSLKKWFSPQKIAILLFLSFWIFHYYSISTYALIALIIAWTRNPNAIKKDIPQNIYYIFVSIFVCISLIGGFYSYKFYHSEILYWSKKYPQAQENFSHPKYLIETYQYSQASELEWLISQRNLREQIIAQDDRITLCKTLVYKYPSVENYFYCWEIFEGFENKQLSLYYYKLWLERLPDLWNNESRYWNNYFIKKSITGNRFFSEKHGDIKSILEKIEK